MCISDYIGIHEQLLLRCTLLQHLQQNVGSTLQTKENGSCHLQRHWVGKLKGSWAAPA
jgi:hypothetical protein